MPSATQKRRNPRKRGSGPQRKSQSAKKRQQDSDPADDVKRDSKGNVVYPMNFAGPIRRLYAFTIDLGLLMMVIYTVAPVSGGKMFSSEAAPQDLLFFFGYFVIPTMIWGRTPGKWVAGVVVVDENGLTPGPAAIPREMIGKFVSFLAAGIGLIWIVFDPKRQGWHDKIAQTFVVENPYSGGPRFMRDFFKIGERKADDKGNTGEQAENENAEEKS